MLISVAACNDSNSENSMSVSYNSVLFSYSFLILLYICTLSLNSIRISNTITTSFLAFLRRALLCVWKLYMSNSFSLYNFQTVAFWFQSQQYKPYTCCFPTMQPQVFLKIFITNNFIVEAILWVLSYQQQMVWTKNKADGFSLPLRNVNA
jgi:hypothetical protein